MELAPDRHLSLPISAYKLGQILITVESVADVAQAIECYLIALKYLPEDNSNFPHIANRLGAAFFKRGNRPDDYTYALEYYRKAINSISKKHQNYAMFLANAADALCERQHDGDTSEAIAYYREALRLQQIEGAEAVLLAWYEFRLGRALRRSASQGDLDEAVEQLNRAVIHGEGNVDRHWYYNVLGLALQDRGGIGDLDESVKYHRRAIELLPESEQDHVYEDNLGYALHTRRAAGDVQEAREHYLKADEIAIRVGATSSTIAKYAHRVGSTYDSDFLQTEDMEKAVVWYRKAVELECEDHLSLAIYLTSLGGTLADLGRGLDGLNSIRLAIALTPEDHSERPFRLQRLGECLICDVDEVTDRSWIPEDWLHGGLVQIVLDVTFAPCRSIEIADEAVSTITEAIELSRQMNNNEQMTHSLAVQADCLMCRHTLTKEIGELEEASKALRTIFGSQWRKDKRNRVLDMLRFGALCLRLCIVAESRPIDDLTIFVGMADTICNDLDDGEEEPFNEMLQAIKGVARGLLSKDEVGQWAGHRAE
jgi:tetratricopeptide (TPR) repeat protein